MNNFVLIKIINDWTQLISPSLFLLMQMLNSPLNFIKQSTESEFGHFERETH